MISPAQRHRILQRWYAGDKVTEIAADVGVYETDVYRIAREYAAATLKPALDPSILARLDDIDKKLGFS
jgi:hypothetical protein